VCASLAVHIVWLRASRVLTSPGELNCAATVRTSRARLMCRLIDNVMASVEPRQIEQVVELAEQRGVAASRRGYPRRKESTRLPTIEKVLFQ
jgi:hypothetical protein